MGGVSAAPLGDGGVMSVLYDLIYANSLRNWVLIKGWDYIGNVVAVAEAKGSIKSRRCPHPCVGLFCLWDARGIVMVLTKLWRVRRHFHEYYLLSRDPEMLMLFDTLFTIMSSSLDQYTVRSQTHEEEQATVWNGRTNQPH